MVKTKIKSMTTEPERFYCCSGTKMKPIYEYKVSKNGKKQLIKTGETNLYDEIQSHKESVSIETIMKHLAIGDKTDFRPDGIYADVSNMPTNMIDAMNAMNDLNNTWNKLPNSIKDRYNKDINIFMAQAGTEAWLIDMGLLNPTQKETIKATETVPKTEVETPKVETPKVKTPKTE